MAAVTLALSCGFALRPLASRRRAPARGPVPCTPRRWTLASRVVVALLLWLALGASGAQLAAEAGPAVMEQRVKAASLFRFLSYVDWPQPATEAPYRIGVLGADDLVDDLTSVVAGRLVNGRSVTIRRLQAGEPLNDLDELYVGYADVARVASVVRRAQGQALLIVTSADGALGHGSMVNFRLVDDRVRFEVALDAAEQAGLRISSRMLSVAVQVIRTQAR